MNFIFLMDPLENVIYEKDTTYLLMLESCRKKHRVFFLSANGIKRERNQIVFQVTEVQPQRQKTQPFIILKSQVLTEDEVDAVFIRTDPPFDDRYLLNTWLLDLLPAGVFVMNHPAAIRTVNEKIWATQFTEIIPETLIASDKKSLVQFLNFNKEVVAKPTDGFGGKSIFRVKHTDLNAPVILETLTQNFTRAIILQKYVKAAQDGDKRILLLNGEPLGAVNRVHSDSDHRNNFFSGGKPQKVSITKNDLKIIKVLKPHLQSLGLHFVGIDIIGKYLIEVNVTSPTCAQEINRLNQTNIEKEIITYVERNLQCRT